MAGLKNVLLVEDDALIVELYTTMLTRGQYTVETAGSAEELYSKLAEFHPDCVLLDVMLPGTSGLEILSELRKNPKYGCQNAKIVMLTNLLEPSVKDKAIEAGADGYVIKSEILPKDLLEIIPSLEDNGEPAAQPAAPSPAESAPPAAPTIPTDENAPSSVVDPTPPPIPPTS